MLEEGKQMREYRQEDKDRYGKDDCACSGAGETGGLDVFVSRRAAENESSTRQ